MTYKKESSDIPFSKNVYTFFEKTFQLIFTSQYYYNIIVYKKVVLLLKEKSLK